MKNSVTAFLKFLKMLDFVYKIVKENDAENIECILYYVYYLNCKWKKKYTKLCKYIYCTMLIFFLIFSTNFWGDKI